MTCHDRPPPPPPRAWPVVPLGALVECLDAARVPLNRAQRAQRPGPVPYHGASGVTGHVDQALFDGALVLLGEDGAPFSDPSRDVAFFHEGPLWAGNHVHVLRPRAGVDGRFVAHALNTLSYGPYVEGATRTKLTRARMNSLPVPCPSLACQRLVADRLEGRLQRIDGQLRVLDRLDALGPEQVRAIITQAIGAAGGTRRLLGHVFDITGGGTPATTHAAYWGDDVAWITPADLPSGPPAVVARGLRGLSAAGLAACRATLVPAGALVVSTRAPVGRVGLGCGPLAVSQGCKALVPRGRGVDLRYAALALWAAGPELRRRAGGSVFPEVDTLTLASLELTFPALAGQRQVAQAAWARLEHVAAQAGERARLRGLLHEYRIAVRRSAMGA
ncbi:restriction endonuclease subunit S [Komagataeibacter sp. AV436]|uniref:Restriction endonuclease subunit S n=1 Tax=Komagataeibacter melomenusus TaxID=2766578 RepID=A0ABX2A936_9PROT|nr:restriction endonuclease subunit S [Komagataeibacter melomenusus]NPC64879.1 restriction endonuclease subunit S [Komagataeibacter melomenusus]